MSPLKSPSYPIPHAHHLREYHTASSFVVLISLGLLLFVGSPAVANEITVNTTTDGFVVDGRCSLREAVQAANTDSPVDNCGTGNGHDVIVLPIETPHTLTEVGDDENLNQTGDLDITEDLTIRSGGADSIATINANDLDRIFEVFPGVELRLERLSITGGDVSDLGGAIMVNSDTSSLWLDTCFVTSNEANLFGGGISSSGPVHVENSTIANNFAGLGGGGVYMPTASLLTLIESEVTLNRTSLDGANLNLHRLRSERSAITAGTAGRDGGGILWRWNGDAGDTSQLINTTVANNRSEEDGGGIYFASPGSVHIYSSTIAGNVASNGNAAGVGSGGGIYRADGTVQIQNTILGKNIDESISRGGDAVHDCWGTISSGGYNLISTFDPDFCTLLGVKTGNQMGTNAAPLDPLLDGLKKSDATPHMPPCPGSPVIDMAAPVGCFGDSGFLSTDQIGAPRAADGGGGARCDIGSIEFVPAAGMIFSDGFESGNANAWGDPARGGEPPLPRGDGETCGPPI